ncbi:ABC-type lipoprotein release transport system permease subunit [Methanomicrobium sp. W14]|uniref:hypothetical protein n=1 Tax=Methanomicrobium sp. W14 TaxID=2817839 RepID=UPI001FD97F98|nr:hypothetical protein [Methanomicrobium sp. W14]MBP2134496.1 ABC-type lipoprotein release transport system permease subunit [Methanomicrobium sp. W14]
MFGGGNDDESYISKKQLQKIDKVVASANCKCDFIAMHSDSDTIYVRSEKGHSTIYGADMASVENIVDVEEGNFPTGDNGVVIGPTLADRYDLNVGAT